ncbi:hypothetical protein AAC387_Pa08g2002 [Persea americana]
MSSCPNADSYIPSLSSSSSTQFAQQGDRFIPTRSLMNLDMAQFSLRRRKNPRSSDGALDFPAILTAKEEYRRRLEENLTMDSEGKPFKMLAFKGNPKCHGGRLRVLDEMMKVEQGQSNVTKTLRSLPKAPEKILDAPNLVDNYYLNLIDWGQNNVLAVALGLDLYLFNVATGVVQKLMRTDANDYVTCVAWFEDGRTLAVGHNNSKLQLWDATSSTKLRSFRGHKATVDSLSWSGHLLSSGSRDALIINHDVRAASYPSSCLRGHSGEVCGLRWSPNGKLLASGGDDNLVHIWEATNMASSKYLHRLDEHCAAIKALAWCPYQSSILASGGGKNDRCIKMWDAKTGQCLSSLDTKAQVSALVWNKHQKEILSGHGYGQRSLCLWRYPSMSKIGELQGHTSRVLNLSQSPDGATVVSAGTDETLRFWKAFDSPQSMHSRIDDRESDSLLSIKRMQIR